MRKLPVFVFALLLGLTSIGCDSSEDDPSDAEIFIGTWNLVSLTDGEGDKTAALAQITNSFRATLESDNDYEINVDYTDESGIEDLTIPGTYTVNEGEKKLLISTPIGQDVPFDYVIENDQRIRLSTNANFVNVLFQTDTYVGTVVITIVKA